MPVLIRQAWRFARVGVLATLAHVLIALWLIRALDAHPALANGAAFVVANLLSYVLNTIWSFESRIGIGSWLRFVLVSLTGLGMTLAISGAAAAAGLPDYLGIGLVVVCVPALSFALHRYWTYRGPSVDSGESN